jgi:hypothetical protein
MEANFKDFLYNYLDNLFLYKIGGWNLFWAIQCIFLLKKYVDKYSNHRLLKYKICRFITNKNVNNSSHKLLK